MKYIALLMVGFVIILSSTGYCYTISVSSADGLLNAIGPNRTIQLSPGDYVLSDVMDRYMDYIRWTPEFDGNTITVRNVKNLKIIGSRGGATRLLVRPRYVYVLSFENCENVELANLVMGHSPETGNCTSGVIGASNCSNLEIRSCDLFGSGTEGLTLANVRNMVFHESTIRDCTYGIMTIKGCANLQFTQSSFIRNKEFWAVNIHDSKDISFVDCSFKNNYAKDKPLFGATSSSNIIVKECNLADNKVMSATNNVTAVIFDMENGF